MIWVLLGTLMMLAIGVILYYAEKERYCPKCGRELKIWSYKKMICTCGHTTT